MSKMKTVKAKSVHLRTPIAWGGTVEAPLTKPIHGTAYKRTEGVIQIALANGEHTEVRPNDEVRISYDPVGVRAAHLRLCHGGGRLKEDGTPVCPEVHPRRIGTDKIATAYCDALLGHYAKNPTTKAQQMVKREQARVDQINERVGRLMTERPTPSKDRMRASVLKARISLHGAEHRFVANMARDYGMTVDEAIALVEREYDMVIDRTPVVA